MQVIPQSRPTVAVSIAMADPANALPQTYKLCQIACVVMQDVGVCVYGRRAVLYFVSCAYTHVSDFDICIIHEASYVSVTRMHMPLI